MIGMRAAAIGIGSNSLRMLIADIQQKDAQLQRVKRDREGLRVFAALDDNQNISQEMIRQATQSVTQFVNKAKAMNAEQIHIFATSAVRDARNSDVFTACIQQETGIQVDICSGEVEAKLSFLGSTGPQRSGMIDIGGGSTEIVIGQGKQIDLALSLQMGAVRLYRMAPIRTPKDAYDVVKLADTLLMPQQDAILTLGDVVWVGVGGTFTTTAALAQNISWMSKTRIHGYALTKKEIARCMEWIAPMTLERRKRLNGLQPQRADIVVHGLAILLSCMQNLNIPAITVSEYGNLEGYLRYHYLL